MERRVKHMQEVNFAQEISVDWNGYNYLVIYGMHANGGFCCVPNWGISCEMSDPSDRFFNTESLTHAFGDKNMGKVVADAIADFDKQREPSQLEKYQLNEMIQELGRSGKYPTVVEWPDKGNAYIKCSGVSDDSVRNSHLHLKTVERIQESMMQTKNDVEHDMER